MAQRIVARGKLAQEATDRARDVAEDASPWIIRLGRFGYVC